MSVHNRSHEWVQLEAGVTREKQKEKTPRISRIFTDLAKADIK
jgi:hypothetical protein